MRTIDLSTWPRRAQYELYREVDFPYFSLTAQVDVGGLKEAAQAAGSTLTVALIYLLSRVANQMSEFRTRIRPKQVIVHEVVHPSVTVLADSEQLGFCTIPFSKDFQQFNNQAMSLIERAKLAPSLQDPPGADDMLFMTSIPWVAFSGIVHPIPLNPPDSVPRIAWGKITGAPGSASMPLSVQCHHAVMDGLHVGRYYEALELLLSKPQVLFRSS